jgi:hypothetical protein
LRVGELQGGGRRIEPAKLPGHCRDTLARTVCLSRRSSEPLDWVCEKAMTSTAIEI